MTSLDSRFAAGVREQLVDTASGTSALAVRTRRVRVGLGVGIGLAAALVLTAGALVVAGLVPGQHVVTDLGGEVTATGSGTSTVELGARPEGANAVTIVLTCTGVGMFDIQTSVSESAHMECADVDEITMVSDERMQAPIGNTMSIADLVLVGDATSFVITASEGATWSVVANYAKTITTEWGVNANGQTYGTPNENGSPDLVAAQATNGEVGYILLDDTWREGSFTVPVYESDGETVIGEFVFGSN